MLLYRIRKASQVLIFNCCRDQIVIYFQGLNQQTRRKCLHYLLFRAQEQLVGSFKEKRGKIKKKFEKEKISWRTTINSLTSISLYAVVY